ncbi:MAG: hypothetical protein HC799_19050 [Limnothrix sp. RL_2_0]|nr:hypothetical protein [Limnothrix sp. RL_2_0]
MFRLSDPAKPSSAAVNVPSHQAYQCCYGKTFGRTSYPWAIAKADDPSR